MLPGTSAPYADIDTLPPWFPVDPNICTGDAMVSSHEAGSIVAYSWTLVLEFTRRLGNTNDRWARRMSDE